VVNKLDIISSPHKHDGSTVSSVMLRVCLALVPGILCYLWFFGIGIVIQCMLSIGFALIIEALMLKLRHRSLRIYLHDGSAIVTALLFALMITPFSPWWISLTGVTFGLVFAKHLYGGLGYNPFNPAVTGYIFVLLCFPVLMNHWPLPTGLFNQSNNATYTLNKIFSSAVAIPSQSVDLSIDNTTVINDVNSLSGATPLTHMQTQIQSMEMISEIKTDSMYGNFGGKGWEWISFAFLLGGIGMIWMKIISWRIPVTVLGSLFLTSMVFNFYDADIYASPFFHLFSGGTMLCAFFIATDPVTASTTPRGRIIYGCIIGLTAYVIRVWGAFPDGIAFAVLIANSLVPLIDRYTRLKVLGES